MSNEVDEETLNQYFDGELPPEKERLVRLVLEGSATDRARVARLERVGDFVRTAAKDSAEDLDSEALFASIQKGVREQAEAGFGERFSMIDGGGADGKSVSIRPIERWKLSIPLAVGLAAAAAVGLVIVNSQTTANQMRGTGVPTPSNIEVSLGSEVESVDFGPNTGTVFAVKGDAGEPLAVVWLNDEPSEELR